MAIFEDGSYSSTPGIALIAKVLAGRCQMHYTRAAVGKGEIPEGETPKTMTEPADYVMDAMISAVTNPVNGECQVTIQINSSDVEHGFYATGILLYAQDPDEGEVPYTYLVLENGPEWIRPSSSAVGKLATFDLIAAVGEVDKVTATIDPDSIVTRPVVERLIAEAVEAVETQLSNKADKGLLTEYNLEPVPENWILGLSTYYKDDFGVVRVHVSLNYTGTDDASSEKKQLVLGVLPEGYRPRYTVEIGGYFRNAGETEVQTTYGGIGNDGRLFLWVPGTGLKANMRVCAMGYFVAFA